MNVTKEKIETCENHEKGEKKMQKSERETLFEILTTETFARFDK